MITDANFDLWKVDDKQYYSLKSLLEKKNYDYDQIKICLCSGVGVHLAEALGTYIKEAVSNGIIFRR